MRQFVKHPFNVQSSLLGPSRHSPGRHRTHCQMCSVWSRDSPVWNRWGWLEMTRGPARLLLLWMVLMSLSNHVADTLEKLVMFICILRQKVLNHGRIWLLGLLRQQNSFWTFYWPCSSWYEFVKWMGTNCFTTSNGMSALSSSTVQIASLPQWGICVPVWNQSDWSEMDCSTSHHLHLQRVRMGLSNPVVNNMEGNLPFKRTTSAPRAKD